MLQLLLLLSVLTRALYVMLLLLVTVPGGTPLGDSVLRRLLRWLAHDVVSLRYGSC